MASAEAHDVAHSPAAVVGTLPEPQEIQGDARRWREVSPGMFLGITDLRLDTPLAYHSHTFPAICLSVVLEGFATNTTRASKAGSARTRSGSPPPANACRRA
jgi:hypothetical protein